MQHIKTLAQKHLELIKKRKELNERMKRPTCCPLYILFEFHEITCQTIKVK